MMNRFLLTLSVMFMLITATKNATARITKEKLFCTPDLISAKVSPDGKLLAKVGANELGITNVSIVSIDGNFSTEWLSYFKTPEVIQFFWSADSKKILLLKNEDGTGLLNLHGFDIESKEHICYTKQFPKVHAKVIKLHSSENKAIIGLNHRNPPYYDLYILDLNSTEFTLLLQNDIYAKFLVSDTLDIILKMKINEDGSWTIFLKNDEVLLNFTPEEAFQTEFLSYDSQDKVIYFLDNRFSNTDQLTQKDTEKPYQEKVLGGQTFSDVDEVLFVQGKPMAYASYYTQKKWHVLNSDIQQDIDFLIKNVGSNFEFINQNQDGKTWVIKNSIPEKGVYFWVYKRDTHTLIQISPLDSRACENYSKMYEEIVTTRDGKQLVCYYTIPKEYDKGGFVEAPLPLVVIPNGGPFKVRYKYPFNPYHQWLASCGYIVLSINFRLSSGFGKEFVNAGNGQWGGKSHLDVIDAIEACIAKRLTKKGKLAIFGDSYGGHESLAALTFTPEYFNCCVAICGPSNLKTVLKSIPEFWEFPSKPLSDNTVFFTKQAFINSMGGNPNNEKESYHLENCSPLNHLENIQVPPLLVHGKSDHIVVENESRQI